MKFEIINDVGDWKLVGWFRVLCDSKLLAVVDSRADAELFVRAKEAEAMVAGGDPTASFKEWKASWDARNLNLDQHITVTQSQYEQWVEPQPREFVGHHYSDVQPAEKLPTSSTECKDGNHVQFVGQEKCQCGEMSFVGFGNRLHGKIVVSDDVQPDVVIDK